MNFGARLPPPHEPPVRSRRGNEAESTVPQYLPPPHVGGYPVQRAKARDFVSEKSHPALLSPLRGEGVRSDARRHWFGRRRVVSASEFFGPKHQTARARRWAFIDQRRSPRPLAPQRGVRCAPRTRPPLDFLADTVIHRAIPQFRPRTAVCVAQNQILETRPKVS